MDVRKKDFSVLLTYVMLAIRERIWIVVGSYDRARSFGGSESCDATPSRNESSVPRSSFKPYDFVLSLDLTAVCFLNFISLNTLAVRELGHAVILISLNLIPFSFGVISREEAREQQGV